MTNNEFRKLLKAEPFKRFRVRLSNGRIVVVRHPDFACCPPGAEFAMVYCAQARAFDRLWLEDVESVEIFRGLFRGWTPGEGPVKPEINIAQSDLEAFCRKWKVREILLYGSVLRDDFGPESDIDVILDFFDDATWDYFDWPAIQDDLSPLFWGREIHLLPKSAVLKCQNPWMKHEIVTTMKPIYSSPIETNP